MRLAFLSALPPLDKTARLPIALAALLLAALAFQFLGSSAVELPEAGPVGGLLQSPARIKDVRPASGAPAIVARSMFAPVVSSDAKGADPNLGVVIAGSIRIGGKQFAVVQGPSGQSSTVRVGGQIGNWSLRAIRENGAVLTRNQEQVIVPFGARGVLPATAAATRSQ